MSFISSRYLIYQQQRKQTTRHRGQPMRAGRTGATTAASKRADACEDFCACKRTTQKIAKQKLLRTRSTTKKERKKEERRKEKREKRRRRACICIYPCIQGCAHSLPFLLFFSNTVCYSSLPCLYLYLHLFTCLFLLIS